MSRRVGSRKLEQLKDRLSARDLDVLVSLRIYRLMNGEQIRTIHFRTHATDETSRRVCRRVLSRLSELRLLARLDRRVGGIRAGSAGYVYTLSPLGHRCLGTTGRKRSGEPTFAFVAHTLATTDLAVRLIDLAATTSIEILDLQPEPAAWRTFTAGMIRTTLKPDLYVRLANLDYELNWFVEIDCGTESRPTIQRKCQVYPAYRQAGLEQERHGVFPKTLWVAPNNSRAKQIRAAIESDRRIDPALFMVATTENATAVLTDFDETGGP